MFRMRDRALNTRADRRDGGSGLFIAEGDLVVERALAAGCVPVGAFVDAAAPPSVLEGFGPEAEIFCADEAVRRVGMGLGVPLSIVALFKRPPRLDARAVAENRRVVVLEAVDNPVNVGTVVRSAVALGWGGLLLDRTSADPLARRALRVSMGNSFALPFGRAENLVAIVEEARTAGTLVVAMTPSARSMPLHSVLPSHRQRVMLVIGSERTGLSPELLDAASVHAGIPMAEGVDSMNAAAAAAIACYALRPISRAQIDATLTADTLRW